MNARRIILAAAALLLGLAPLSGLEWGLVLDNTTTVGTAEESGFDQSDRLALFMKAAMGPAWSFEAKGSYTYADDRLYLFNLDALELQGRFPTAGRNLSMFELGLGRFRMTDFTGRVVDHPLDGFSLSFLYPAAEISFGLGYAGLQLKPASTINMSRADDLDSGDDEVLLAPARVVGSLQVAFPELFARQDITFALLFQQDLHAEEDLVQEGGTAYNPATGGLLNTQYVGLGAAGPLAATLYYDLFGWFGTGRSLTWTGEEYVYKPILSGLGGLGLRLYLEQFLSSQASLRVLYASGDADAESFVEGNTRGSATTFIPISKRSPALVFEPVLGNLILLEAGYSLKPLSWIGVPLAERLQASVKAVTFLRATTGPVGETGLDADSDALYLGTEVDGTVNWRPFSDLGLAFSLGLFLPNGGSGGAFLPAAGDPELLARLEFSFSF